MNKRREREREKRLNNGGIGDSTGFQVYFSPYIRGKTAEGRRTDGRTDARGEFEIITVERARVLETY